MTHAIHPKLNTGRVSPNLKKDGTERLLNTPAAIQNTTIPLLNFSLVWHTNPNEKRKRSKKD